MPSPLSSAQASDPFFLEFSPASSYLAPITTPALCLEKRRGRPLWCLLSPLTRPARLSVSRFLDLTECVVWLTGLK